MNPTSTRAARLRICLAAAILIGGLGQALPDEWTVNCLLVNRVTDSGDIRTLTDRQIERGLCLITKETVSAIAANDAFKQEVCWRASVNMMKEFRRRFPGRDGKELVGSC